MAVKSDRNHLICFAPVAQLDRASGYGPEGREFESSSARQRDAGLNSPLSSALFFTLAARQQAPYILLHFYNLDPQHADALSRSFFTVA